MGSNEGCHGKCSLQSHHFNTKFSLISNSNQTSLIMCKLEQRQQRQPEKSVHKCDITKSKHFQSRKKIVKLIALILHTHKERINSTNTCTTRIPVLAKAMECLLYCNASSFEEYMAMSTFYQRLNTVMIDYTKQGKEYRDVTDFSISKLSESVTSIVI